MPRQARIVIPGQLHHVTQRGNYRQKVFFEDQDRVVYLKYLQEFSESYGVEIYAFCLMPNHVHFIVKPSRPDSLAKTFRLTHQKYSLYINKRLNEFGHRWQSRFYSCLVLGDHIFNAVRYVEMNPVRANIVSKPWHYPWSSARAHLGTSYSIIDLSDINEYIDLPSWKDYLLEEFDTEKLDLIRSATDQGKILGSAELIEKLGLDHHKNYLPRPRGRPKF